MIGMLEGQITAHLGENAVLLEVHGVGYAVYVPAPLYAEALQPQQTRRLYITTVLRENALSLYGFSEWAGKHLFETLIKTPRIGPKLALAMLSIYEPQILQEAIRSANIPVLVRIPGIGKRTAEKMCLELQDKLEVLTTDLQPHALQQDLRSVLINLGYAEETVATVITQLDPAAPLEDQVKAALALLSTAG